VDLENFSDVKVDLTPIILRVASEEAEKLASAISAAAPSKSGQYASGWTSRPEPDGATTYNSGHHVSLGHLLEFGHRSKGRYVAPRPHIRPTYTEAIELYQQRLLEEVEKLLRETFG